jgi:hypothetical protein
MSGSGFGPASAFRGERPRQIDRYIDDCGGAEPLVAGFVRGQKCGAHPDLGPTRARRHPSHTPGSSARIVATRAGGPSMPRHPAA